MDKVIIDGVNVSECNAYKDKHCLDKTSIMFTEYNLCSNFSDCYFKQLKRAREEIEDIKTEYEVFKNIASAECERARAENERLKEENKHLTEKEEEAKHYLQEADKFQQCLQEIKDIADRTDGNHPASVINMVSVIRHTINSVIGAEE